MKMEVLSVQNHIQGQFGVNKIKDWTSPLTAPGTTGVGVASPAHPAAGAGATDEEDEEEHDLELKLDVVDSIGIVDVDVVDGHPASVLHMRQHQALGTRHSGPTTGPIPVPPSSVTAAKSSSSSSMAASFDVLNGGGGGVGSGGAAYHHHHHHLHHAYMTNVLSSTAAMSAVNNNTTPPSTPAAVASAVVLPASPLQSTAGARFGAADNLDDVSAIAVEELSQQLQCKLRDAKSRHLACTEVTLPYDLTQRIAAEIIRMSEREPCGERACTIFIEFESEPNNVRRIASFKVDPDTVSIFELYLTLKQDKSGWTSLLPQFLKNLTRSNTIIISPDFTLTKNKLYSSE
ncbi:uncharacterized protein Dwil_GK17172 [Drosophila willistoni]|uniref:Protein charybde n=1 Tax=Drosophila willistoni TaxID=7260 RepID=B4MKN8_DROWI|nr:protein charybde [Drosophila willistoni]EDW72744.2 uncharacterized protein Dwil_GK17172 [Drosophila willistoni]